MADLEVNVFCGDSQNCQPLGHSDGFLIKLIDVQCFLPFLEQRIQKLNFFPLLVDYLTFIRTFSPKIIGTTAMPVESCWIWLAPDCPGFGGPVLGF